MSDPRGDGVGAFAARRYLTFRVQDKSYALRAGDVGEVVRVPPVTRVPQSPDALLGVANLRGAVLPVVSARRLLRLPDASTKETPQVIVLTVGAPLGLVVDAVEALVSVEPDRVQAAESAVAAPGERLEGVFDAGTAGGPTSILDIRSLLDEVFTQRARTPRQDSRGVARAGYAAVERDAGDTAAAATMLVTFEVAGQEFALELGAVQEIVAAPAGKSAVPQAEALVLGIATLRGALLPLLSLRGLLGFPAAPGNARETVVVMSIKGAQVGLVADRARSILAADPTLIDPIPAVLAARAGGESRIRAVYRADGGRRLVSILAPEQLFRDDVMQRLSARQDSSDRSAARADKKTQESLAFLVFRLGPDEYALPIDDVDEVAVVPTKITRMPKAPRFLEGIVNLRGHVLPVIDQRQRFDMPRQEASPGRRLVVVRTRQHRAGVIVDGVSDVLRVAADAVQAAPELTDDIGTLVRGVINLTHPPRMVLVLDPSELLTRAERRLLDAFAAATPQDGV